MSGLKTLEHSYSLFIKARPEEIWQALTDPRLTTQYYFGSPVESEWQVGSPVEIKSPDGSIVLFAGRVVESDQPRRLVHTVNVVFDPSFANKEEMTLRWEIEQHGEVCLLTVTHEAFEPDAKIFEMLCASSATPMLSAMKTFLETGTPLELGLRPPVPA